MAVEIRTIELDELAEFIAAVRLGFLNDPDEATVAAAAQFRRPRVDPSRTWAAFDGSRCVGTFRSVPFELTAPLGRLVAADGVTAVTVSPTHTRQGLLTRMMACGLGAAADRGDPVSILIAAEYPIYGRYGYAPATEAATLAVDARRARVRRVPAGTVELVEATELRRLAPPVYERYRLARPGALSRDDLRWDSDLGIGYPPGLPVPWRGRAVVHLDDGGEVDGFAEYHVETNAEGLRGTATLHLDELIPTTPQALAGLWRYCLEVDLVGAVRAPHRPVDEPLPWLLADGRAVQVTDRDDFLWLRLLDVPAALAARGYLRVGRVVLEVLDPGGPAGGRFALDAGPDGVECRRTGESADLTLPVTTLAAAYLGGFRLRTLADAGLLDAHRPGAVAAADALLAGDVPPWCTMWF